MSLLVTLYDVESLAGISLGIICLGFLLFAYFRSRLFALLALAAGNALYLFDAFIEYGFRLAHIAPNEAVQLTTTGFYVAGSMVTTFGMAALCVRLARRSI